MRVRVAGFNSKMAYGEVNPHNILARLASDLTFIGKCIIIYIALPHFVHLMLGILTLPPKISFQVFGNSLVLDGSLLIRSSILVAVSNALPKALNSASAL